MSYPRRGDLASSRLADRLSRHLADLPLIELDTAAHDSFHFPLTPPWFRGWYRLVLTPVSTVMSPSSVTIVVTLSVFVPNLPGPEPHFVTCHPPALDSKRLLAASVFPAHPRAPSEARERAPAADRRVCLLPVVIVA